MLNKVKNLYLMLNKSKNNILYEIKMFIKKKKKKRYSYINNLVAYSKSYIFMADLVISCNYSSPKLKSEIIRYLKRCKF